MKTRDRGDRFVKTGNTSALHTAQVTGLRYIAIAATDGRTFMAATDGGAGVPQDRQAAEDQETTAGATGAGDLATTDDGAGLDRGTVAARADSGVTRASDRERD